MDPPPVGAAPQGKKRKEPPTSSADKKKSSFLSSKPRPAKRARFADARKIESQPQDAALKDGELDLQAFMNARAFEIEALESSMQKSTASKSRRAFQSVPREMRRRTASHNAKRVPKRLRPKAKREMAADNTPTVTQKRRLRTTRARLRAETARRLDLLIKRKKRQMQKVAEEKGDPMDLDKSTPIATRKPRPKIRRNSLNDPPAPKSKFRKRQKDKTWLPTHIWHAKRATMSEPKKPRWGFAIPLTPTQKSYRPTHRAIHQSGGVIAWDMSYMSTIGLYGNHVAVEALVREACQFDDAEWKSKGELYMKGCQPAYTWIYYRDKHKAIAPATIIFNPKPPLPRKKARRPKVQDLREYAKREVFFRVHPSAFNETWELLRRLVKMRSGLYIEDLRYEIGSIELMGSNSTEVLRATLHPYWTLKRDREMDVDFYRGMDTGLGPENHPGRPMFGFSTIDPRLRFPQKKLEDKLTPHQIIERNREMIRWMRIAPETPYFLFNREARQTAIDNLPSQKSINKRRRESPPGKFPDLKPEDPPIPIILYIQRDPSRWVVLAPFKLIEPIWNCLIKCPISTGGEVRFGGLQEQQQAAFEQDLGWFPADFPATKSGQKLELEERAEQARIWERRPKSKRVEWKSVDLGLGRRGELGNGHACDWEFLFKLPPVEVHQVLPQSTTRPNKDKDEHMAGSAQEAPTQISLPKDTENPLHDMVRFSRPQWESLLINCRRSIDTEVPELAVCNVKLTFLRNGKASRCARIYRLPSRSQSESPALSAEIPAIHAPPKKPGTLPADLRDQWLAEMPASKRMAERAREALDKDRRQKKRTANKNRPKDTDPNMGSSDALEVRQRRVAEALFTTAPPPTLEPPPDPKETSMNGHPFVPDEVDLIGFVTTGAFNLRLGKPAAIGSISVAKAKEDLHRHQKLHEVATCIVRNVGESVGWLARWEVI